MERILSLPWYKIPEEQREAEMDCYAALGARKIVLPQYFFHKDVTAPGGYPAQFGALLRKHGLEPGAAHALLGPENDLGCAGPEALDNHKRHLSDLAFAGGVTTYTAHSGAHYALPSQTITDDQFWDHFRRSIDQLLPVLEETGIILAMENIYAPLPCLQRMVDIVLSYNHPLLGFCLDTGHANISKHGLDVVYELFKSKLVTAHLHDNDGVTDLHIAPGKGIIDWESLCARLNSTPSLLNVQTETKSCTPEVWAAYQQLPLAEGFSDARQGYCR